MSDNRIEAAIIYESHLPDALRRALIYAGDDGFLASMPELLRARVNASFENIIWNTWFTANSEESVIKTPQGNHVLVTVHGGGIFSTPERFLALYHASVDRASELGFTGMFAGKISEKEARELLQGKLPDGTEIPLFSFDEFKHGIADLPQHYAVVTDFELAQQSISGYAAFDDLRDDSMMIVRAGGVEPLGRYLDKARDRGNSDTIGSWHVFNELDPDQPQACTLLLYGGRGGARDKIYANEGMPHLRGIENEFGLCGSAGMINSGRFVAVAPRNVSTSVRHLSFNA
jgi:hypothetical protein